MPLLEVDSLHIAFAGRSGVKEAVRGISFSIEQGRTLAVVGESGSGKSVTAMSLTRLLPAPPACQVSGNIRLHGRDILQMSPRELRAVRGKEIAYVFQEPSTSLNPVFRIGYQIAEAVKLHVPQEKDVHGRVVEALRRVGIQNPEQRVRAYPHELSGGMQQRVMIAMALACEPALLVADEPTTALDATIQKQIIDLLKSLKAKSNMSILLITHNFGIIRDFADEVIVMFRGQIVERGLTEQVLGNPQHPYTRALIDCIPRLGQRQSRLRTIDYSALEVGS